MERVIKVFFYWLLTQAQLIRQRNTNKISSQTEYNQGQAVFSPHVAKQYRMTDGRWEFLQICNSEFAKKRKRKTKPSQISRKGCCSYFECLSSSCEMNLFSQTHLSSWYFLLTDSDPSENLGLDKCLELRISFQASKGDAGYFHSLPFKSTLEHYVHLIWRLAGIHPFHLTI